MKIVCAPDSFKGSLNAAEAAAAMARGAQQVVHQAEVVELPLADGGEGTLDALLSVWGQQPQTVETVDALRRPCVARYGLSPDGSTAIIEAAEANGLPQISDETLQPRRADTYGIGRIVEHVLDTGVEEILLCIGGSATTDGGTGMLTALGVNFLDGNGHPVSPGGEALAQIADLDLAHIHPRAAQVAWRIASDVDNPLTGPRGAAAVFGPQKGADEDDVAALDIGLHHLAGVLAHRLRRDADELRTRNGLGAAGGLPVTLVALLGAEVVPGFTLVAQALGLADQIVGADLIFTGEGRLDRQSLHGKVVDGVASRAPEGAAVVAIAGSVQLKAADCRNAGLAAAFSIAPGAATLAQLQEDSASLIEQTAAHATALYSASRRMTSADHDSPSGSIDQHSSASKSE